MSSHTHLRLQAVTLPLAGVLMVLGTVAILLS